MKLIPAQKTLRSSLGAIERNEGFGFEGKSTNIWDGYTLRTRKLVSSIPSLAGRDPSRAYAPACKSVEDDYVGPIWEAQVNILPRSAVFSDLMEAVDELTEPSMLGEPARIEGWEDLEIVNDGISISNWLFLRYDFEPDQLPKYRGETRDAPLALKFKVKAPERKQRNVIYGDLGARANFILYPNSPYEKRIDMPWVRRELQKQAA